MSPSHAGDAGSAGVAAPRPEVSEPAATRSLHRALAVRRARALAGASGSDAAGASGSARGRCVGSGAAGASGSGAAGASGSDGGQRTATFAIGADITWVQRDEMRGATYSDGTRKDILQLLADHGFNSIRLRTFVDPKAADGYDKQRRLRRPRAHDRVRQADQARGHGLPARLPLQRQLGRSRQAVRAVAWQNLTRSTQLATRVHDYTKDAITS